MPKPFVITSLYIEQKQILEAQLESERARLETMKAAIAACKRGDPDRKALRNDHTKTVSRINTLTKNITNMHDPTSNYWTLWDLVHLLAESRETLWDDEESRLWSEPVQNFEGRGEKSLRYHYASILTSQQPTTDMCDLPELNEEVKNWESYDTNNNRWCIDPFRVGVLGKSAFGKVYRNIIRKFPDDIMCDELWEALSTGEVSPNKIFKRMPEDLSKMIIDGLKPSITLGRYDAINGCSSLGFLRIPRRDYDAAFRLSSISQMSPRYSLSRKYIESKLNETLFYSLPRVSSEPSVPLQHGP